MATRMQQRRGTAQQWLDADPVLAAGEIGFETDTNEFRIGDGVNTWSNLSPFKNLEDLGGSLDDYVLISTKGQANGVASLDSTGNVPASQLANVLDGAPGALDTLNEIAAALGDDSNYATTIINALDAKAGLTYVNLHKDATTNVHGIADTSLLATTANVATAETNATNALSAHASDTTLVHGIADTSLLATTSDVSTAASNAADALSSHSSDTTSVHGITDTANLVYSIDLTNAIEDHNIETTSVHGISNTANLVYSADLSDHTDATTSVHGIANTADLATKNYADGAVSTHNSDTTDVHGIADTAALATKTYADGAVTTAVAALTKSSVGLGNVDNTSDANKPVSSATQTALDLKAPLADPTFTGTVSGVTKAHVGLGNVDNTSDANKPVSTAQATAIATAKTEAIADATSQINAVIASAPAALNTLDELAAALGDDANFATTVTNGLAAKAPINAPTFTGTVTVAAAGIAFTDGTQTKEGVVSRTPIIQKTAGYTLSALTERDSLIEVSSASGVTLTIPTNATLALPVGTSIDILQTGAGQVTIAGAAGVTVNATPGLKLRTQWSGATLFKRATDTWVVYGDLSA